MHKVEDLRVYREGLALFFKCYKLMTSSPELYREFTIKDQLKRSSLSVPLNIIEGFATSKKRFANFLVIAIGSANETGLLLHIIYELFSIDTQDLQKEYAILTKQLHSLRKKLLTTNSSID